MEQLRAGGSRVELRQTAALPTDHLERLVASTKEAVVPAVEDPVSVGAAQVTASGLHGGSPL